MTALEVFGWRKLNPASSISYSFDGTSIYLKSDAGGEPFPAKAWEAWVATSGGWLLRTPGRPTTVGRVQLDYGNLADEVATGVLSISRGGLGGVSPASDAMDPRILIVQTTCEAASDPAQPGGKDVQSPRTEVGYPNRKGENDKGDMVRDQIDWEQSGGMHSSHGLTQCLIGSAVAARPDLFKGVLPRMYRTVLWKPENAFMCLAAAYAKMARGGLGGVSPASARDVVRLRISFGAGGVYPSSKNIFGVRMYAPSVLTRWIAYWNDLAAYLANPSDLGPPPKAPPKKPAPGGASASGGWVLPAALAIGAYALLTRGGGT